MAYTDDELWARFYDGISPGLPGDVEFYAALAREAAGPILELGCGTGRVLGPIAAATAHPVTGIDLSAAMLERSRARLHELPPMVGERVTLVRGDMRDFRLDAPAALILLPYRAFHHLLTVDDQLACLSCIRAALAPGGLVCINCFDPRLDMIEAEGRHLDSVPTPRVDFRDEATGHAVHIETAWREWDPVAQTFGEEWTLTEFAGDAAVGEYDIMLRLRYGFRWEMEHLFRRAGFTIEALYGDFARGPFRYAAEQLWLLRAA